MTTAAVSFIALIALAAIAATLSYRTTASRATAEVAAMSLAAIYAVIGCDAHGIAHIVLIGAAVSITATTLAIAIREHRRQLRTMLGKPVS